MPLGTALLLAPKALRVLPFGRARILREQQSSAGKETVRFLVSLINIWISRRRYASWES